MTQYQENAQLRLAAYVDAGGSNDDDYLPATTPTAPWPPLQQQIYFQILSQTSFGSDDVRAAQNTATSFTYNVVLDGFDPNELAGLTISINAPAAPQPRGLYPTLFLRLSSADPDAVQNNAIAIEVSIANVQPAPLPVPAKTSPAASLPQRYTIPFTLVFNDPVTAFTNVTATQEVTVAVTATFCSNLDWSTSFVIELVVGADPFMLTGPIQYLSADLRAYQVLADDTGNNPFGVAYSGNPNSYITDILSKLNNADASVAALAASFDTDPAYAANPDAAEALVSQISFFPLGEDASGISHPVYNFAIALVTLQDLTVPANNVQVFFRLFPAPSSGTYFASYDAGSAYSSEPATVADLRYPTVGTANGQILTVPSDRRVRRLEEAGWAAGRTESENR